MVSHSIMVKIPCHILKIAEIKLPTLLAAPQLLRFIRVLEIGLHDIQSGKNGVAICMVSFQVATFCALWDVGGKGQNGAVTKL